MDRYLQGIDLLDRINELTKDITSDQKNGWRPLLLACKDEIQRSVDVDSMFVRVFGAVKQPVSSEMAEFLDDTVRMSEMQVVRTVAPDVLKNAVECECKYTPEERQAALERVKSETSGG